MAYFLTADEFVKWVAEEVGIKLAEDEKKVAVEYLDSSGIVSIQLMFSLYRVLFLHRLLIWVVEFVFDHFGCVTT